MVSKASRCARAVVALVAFAGLRAAEPAPLRPDPVPAPVKPSVPADPRYLDGWRMAGANPERTSWVPEEVRGPLKPLWQKPIQPYISQKVQIIAADGSLFLSTAAGLYALDAATGKERWVYPTELPLGHSPTVAEGVAYVGGFDRKLHAVDAKTGKGLWTFEGGAGFCTNPLAVAGKVFAGCRDGVFYAVDAKTGKRVWKFETGGPILFSAAHKDGVVFFASNDGCAYALNGSSGKLVWKSDKLPGAGFHSWWPVVYRGRVIFAGSSNYRTGAIPGISGGLKEIELEDTYPKRKTEPRGTPIGPVGQAPGDWVKGTLTLDASRVLDYLKKKPWRKTCFVLDQATGQEREAAPFLWFGTYSGNRYPPVVGGDGVLYQANNYMASEWIPGGGITGWRLGTALLSIVSAGWKATDEPMAYAVGGNVVYWTVCCNREAGAIGLAQPNPKLFGAEGPSGDAREWNYFSYDLNAKFPELYDKAYPFTCGAHGDQNPPIPYKGRVYLHRYNAILCFSPDGKLPNPGGEDKPAPERLKSRYVVVEPKSRLTGLLADLHVRGDDWPALLEERDLLRQRWGDFIYPPRANDTAQVLRVAAAEGKPTALQVERPAGSPSTAAWSFGEKGSLRAKVFPHFPSMVFESDGTMYRLDGAFTCLAYPSKDGAKTLRDSGSLNGADLAQGWLLAWGGTELPRAKPGFTMDHAVREDLWHYTWLRSDLPRFRPFLLSLQKKPTAVGLSDKGVELTFGGPAGTLVVTPLWGLHNPDPRQGIAWAKELPGEVVEQCRLLDRVARAIPVNAKANWAIDPASGDLTVTSTCEHSILKDEWATEPLRLALLPPELALAAWGKSPIRVEGTLTDLDYALPLGRLAGVADATEAKAAIPGLAKYWRETTRKPASVAADDPLKAKLAREVEKILTAGHLRPGYLSSGNYDLSMQGAVADFAADYFHSPADALHALSRALPFLPEPLRARTLAYLKQELEAYPPDTVTHVGWKAGSAREAFDLPPEFEVAREKLGAGARAWSGWKFPPQTFYALWLYAEQGGRADEWFAKCRARLEDPRFPVTTPYILNSHIAGHVGAYRLAKRAGAAPAELDAMEQQLARLFVLRAALARSHDSLAQAGFEYGGARHTLDSYDPATGRAEFAEIQLGGFPYHKFTLEFLGLVTELGRFLADYAPREVAEAVQAANARHPYWFVARGEEGDGEGTLHPLYDGINLFQAKALILNEPRQELEKRLDVPAFPVGDLFYIHNLAATLEAEPMGRKKP